MNPKRTVFQALALALLCSCATASPVAPQAATLGNTVAKAPDYNTLNLSQLSAAEFAAPGNPQIKLALGKRYWCRGERGVAVEHWLWLKQFSSDPVAKAEGTRLARLAAGKKAKDVDDVLKCEKESHL